MTVREFIGFLNLYAVYFVIQLIRCVLISYAVFALVFLLRKTLLKNRVFLKGAVWSLFLPVLFAGRMRFYYENVIGAQIFSLWTGRCMNHIWLNWLYLCGVFVYAVCLIRKRRTFRRLIAGMEKREVEGIWVYVAKMPVTPFTIGVFRPKIVMPEVMLKEYGRSELQTILLHERIHIRLGHLVFYFLWDVLRVLLWLNPLLTAGTKFFREDMEEICDWATIRHNDGKAYVYGKLLLKSMGILQEERKDFNMYAAFAGDGEYRNIRQRVTRIARYRPYKRLSVVCIAIVILLGTIGEVCWIKNMSYDRYNESDMMFTYGFDGEKVTFLDDSDALYRMISYDDSYVYVDREAFEDYLQRIHAGGDIFIVFGGFYKLPGVGGAGYSCFYEFGSEDELVRIPYENPIDDWRMKLLKIL